jgi:hypothetical protein
MKNFGKNIKVNQKKKEASEKEMFVDLVNLFDECNKRTEALEQTFLLGISTYEEPLFIVIENLLIMHYGEWKAEIVLWWVYDRYDEEGNLLPIELNFQDENKQENIIVETAEQWWDLIKKIDK